MWQTLVTPVNFDVAAVRWVGGAMLAVGAGLAHVPGNPGLPCPLRTITGVPCPFCGMTTSVKAVMRADLGTAVAANPLGILAVGVAAFLLLRPQLRNLRLPATVLLVGIALSWLVQLHRFQFL